MIRRVRSSLFLCLFLFAARGEDRMVQVSEKDLRTAATYKIEPEYPAVARQIRLTGKVDLLVSVDLAGQVEKVIVVRGNTLLAGASEQAIRKWRFNPFRDSGQPVRVSGPVTFTFSM